MQRELKRRLWSIADLARHTGLHTSTLYAMPAAGPWRIHRTTADRIAKAFEEHPPREMVDELMAAGG